MARSPKKLNTYFFILATVVLVFFLFVQTYSVVTNLHSAIPGPLADDQSIYVWNTWWFSHSAFSSDHSIFFTDHLLYPEGISLALQSHTYVQDAIASLIVPVLGVVGSLNIVLLLGILAAAVGTFFVAREITGDNFAALFSGLAFGFSPYVLERLHGHYDMVAVWPIPWFFYFFIRLVRRQRMRDAGMLGFILGLSVLNGLYYPLFLFIFGFISLLLVGIRKKVIVSKARVRLALVVCATGFMLAFPLLVQYVMVPGSNDIYLAQDVATTKALSASLIDYVRPPTIFPLYDWMHKTFTITDVQIERRVFLTFSVVGLIVVGFVLRMYHRGRRKNTSVFSPLFWWVLLGAAIILSFGPYTTLFGRQLQLPYALFMRLPVLEGLRAPGRFGVMAMLFAVVLAAIAFTQIKKRLTNRSRVFGFVFSFAIIIFLAIEVFVAPLPTTHIPVSSFPVKHIAPNGAVLNIPLGIKDGRAEVGQFYPLAQIFQTQHKQPILDANVSRIPLEDFYMMSEQPGLRYIMHLGMGYSFSEDFDTQKVRATMNRLSIKTIVLYKHQLPKNIENDVRGYIRFVIGADVQHQDTMFEIYRLR